MSTYENDQYYTPLEVAEILGLGKDAILQRCRKGHLEGAYKEPPTPGNPNGQWLIPRRLIDTPNAVQDVATLTRQINPMELERVMTNAIATAVSKTIEPLMIQLNEQSETIQKVKEQSEKNILISNANNEMAGEIKTELSRMKKKEADREKNSNWNFKTIIIPIGVIFMTIVIAVVIGVKISRFL